MYQVCLLFLFQLVYAVHENRPEDFESAKHILQRYTDALSANTKDALFDVLAPNFVLDTCGVERINLNRQQLFDALEHLSAQTNVVFQEMHVQKTRCNSEEKVLFFNVTVSGISENLYRAEFKDGKYKIVFEENKLCTRTPVGTTLINYQTMANETSHKVLTRYIWALRENSKNQIIGALDPDYTLVRCDEKTISAEEFGETIQKLGVHRVETNQNNIDVSYFDLKGILRFGMSIKNETVSTYEAIWSKKDKRFKIIKEKQESCSKTPMLSSLINETILSESIRANLMKGYMDGYQLFSRRRFYRIINETFRIIDCDANRTFSITRQRYFEKLVTLPEYQFDRAVYMRSSFELANDTISFSICTEFTEVEGDEYCDYENHYVARRINGKFKLISEKRDKCYIDREESLVKAKYVEKFEKLMDTHVEAIRTKNLTLFWSNKKEPYFITWELNNEHIELKENMDFTKYYPSKMRELEVKIVGVYPDKTIVFHAKGQSISFDFHAQIVDDKLVLVGESRKVGKNGEKWSY